MKSHIGEDMPGCFKIFLALEEEVKKNRLRKKAILKTDTPDNGGGVSDE